MAGTYSSTGGTPWAFGLGIGNHTVDESDTMNDQNSRNAYLLLAEEYRPRSFYHGCEDDVQAYNTQTAAQITDSYVRFEKGFSDDEGSNLGKLFRPMLDTNPQTTNTTSTMKQYKSPRRSDDDNLEENVRIKKHRSSIFGGPIGLSDGISEELIVKEGQSQTPLFGNRPYKYNDETGILGQARANEIIPSVDFRDDENRQLDPLQGSRSFGLAPSDTCSDYRGSPAPRSEHSYDMPNELRKEMEQASYPPSSTNSESTYENIANHCRTLTSYAQVSIETFKGLGWTAIRVGTLTPRKSERGPN